MKKIWNTKRPLCRILSMVMTMAMTITLLSGCGAAGGTQKSSNTKIQAELPQELRDEIRSQSSLLADASGQVEETIGRLREATDQEAASKAEETIQELADWLSELEQQTADWFAAQKKAETSLSKNTKEVLEERNRAFEKQLSDSREQAEGLLAEIEEALEAGETEKAQEQTVRLEDLLVQKEEPKTYGESLPGEAEVHEPEEEELSSAEESVAEAEKAEPESLSEEELSALLVTEGDTELTEAVKKKAEELGTPLAVYNYLKNNIGYEFYYGSRKGAAGTLDAMGGNDLDQASLLIAMLRHLGMEAEYVRGTIYLTEEQAVSLTGADNIIHASDVLAAAGTPVTRLTLDGEVVQLSMEHVWVRAHIPYTDYRGAGNASGDKVWIDLDTGIKDYEAVTNIYDTLDEEGFSEQIQGITESGDTTGIESLLSEWEERLESEDLSDTYARKRIIKQEEVSYLPLSLQYETAGETETFAQTDIRDKDTITFSVAGQSLGTYTSSELAEKDILLSFRPAGDADVEILDAYDSIFDVPAYSVCLKPVLLINGKVEAQGEDMGATLGTSQTFTMTLHSGGEDTVVDNPVTTGSMYAVTMDSQNITASELQNIYDEVAALKDSVTEENVYSEEYLGKLLNLAGKLYFAQVDIADTVAAEIYDVSNTRSLSEGITGYEVRTSSVYGQITSLSEGSLYIDVDTDSHSVVSLRGDSDVSREYFMSTGMISSLYESTVWEEITGEESVSTISILAKASEENIDILLISKDNLSKEIEKLNTDSTTKRSIINAVNSGMIVTVPTENVTIGDWSGTGYIVTNPETGAGAYMISGGLNGGSVVVPASLTFLAGLIYTIIELVGLFASVIGIVHLLLGGSIILASILLIMTCVAMIVVVKRYVDWELKYTDFLLDGNIEAALEMMYGFANDVETDAKITAVFGSVLALLRYTEWKYGIDIGKEINKILRKYTSSKIQNIINSHGVTVEAFSELLQYDRQLTKEEKELVDAVRNEIGEIPKEGTKMTKVIPQTDIEAYLKGEYTSVRGFVSEAEFSEKLRTLEEVYEGNRLDYENTAFSLSDDIYGKITYSYNRETEIEVPRYEATSANYPYTGKGFTASKNVILPEWQQIGQNFAENDLLEVFDSKTGNVISTYRFEGGMWVEQ